MAGLDLAKVVTCREQQRMDRDRLVARRRLRHSSASRGSTSSPTTSASSATSCACWPAAAAASPWCRRRRRPRRCWHCKPDGIFLSNGPGDPEPCDYAIARVARTDRARHPDLRHLPGPPDHGAGLGRQDLQDEVRPPRRQPPGEGPRLRPRQHHQPEPRLRGGREVAAQEPASDARVAVRRHAARPGAHRQARLLLPGPPGSLARTA